MTWLKRTRGTVLADVTTFLQVALWTCSMNGTRFAFWLYYLSAVLTRASAQFIRLFIMTTQGSTVSFQMPAHHSRTSCHLFRRHRPFTVQTVQRSGAKQPIQHVSVRHFTLMMEAVSTFEMSVHFYGTQGVHFPHLLHSTFDIKLQMYPKSKIWKFWNAFKALSAAFNHYIYTVTVYIQFSDIYINVNGINKTR